MKAEFGDEAILKGGLLWLVESGEQARPTMDADMHCHAGWDPVGRVRRALALDRGDELRFEMGR
jgi:hypothetical protein